MTSKIPKECPLCEYLHLQENKPSYEILNKLEKHIMNSPSTPDVVNHPKHYEGKIECINAMIEARGVQEVKAFCLCNTFKYLWRLGKKDNALQEAKKAQWYLNKYIELTENGN